MLPAVILAGGKGSRIGQYTEHVLKALCFMPGGSLLDHHIQGLRHAGAAPIYVGCAHMANLLAEYVRRRHPFCRILLQEGAVGNAADGLLAIANVVTDDFLVVHVDHWFSCKPFADLFAAHAAGGITFLVEKPEEHQKSGYDLRCLFHKGTKEIDYLHSRPMESKPQMEQVRVVDGCMVLPKEIFPLIRAGRAARGANADMGAIFTYIAEQHLSSMRGVPIRGWWENINDADTWGRTVKRILEEGKES